MKTQYYIGVDVAKATLDITALKDSHFLFHEKIGNTPAEITRWFATLKARYKAGGKNTLFCLEHMGAYKEHLYRVLRQKKAQVWMESALHIKRSLGLARGKSDQLDSLRIARFAFTNKERAKLSEEPREVLLELKALTALRQRLLTVLHQVQVPTKELRSFYKKRYSRLVDDHCAGTLCGVRSDLQKTEETIQELIRWDERLNRLYEIATSVRGIGPVVAVAMIVATNEFKSFSTANQFACHSGVAPFEHTSGTSIQGKTRVSKLANKRMGPLLHMAAVSSISCKGELRDYYLRKVQEGKPRMSVLNAVKNKLIHRVFTCVREDRLYQHMYKPDAEQK